MYQYNPKGIEKNNLYKTFKAHHYLTIADRYYYEAFQGSKGEHVAKK